MRKNAYFLILMISSVTVLFISCKKDQTGAANRRITAELKKAMDDVGRLHNVGLSKVIKDHPEWAQYIPGQAPVYGTSTIKMNTVGKKANEIGASFMSLMEVTHEYFKQFTIDSLSGYYTFNPATLDTITELDDYYWMAPDSAMVSRINGYAPITLSSEMNSHLQDLFDAIDESDNVGEFNSTANALLDDAATYISSDVEFFAFAMGVSVAKNSLLYWTNSDNISAWNTFVDNHEPTGRKTNGLAVKTNIYMLETPGRRIVHSDVVGAVTGGIIGGFLGSFLGPAGTASGAIGGALVRGAIGSALAGVREIWKYYHP